MKVEELLDCWNGFSGNNMVDIYERDERKAETLFLGTCKSLAVLEDGREFLDRDVGEFFVTVDTLMVKGKREEIATIYVKVRERENGR